MELSLNEKVRLINGLLNKISPQNFEVITTKFLLMNSVNDPLFVKEVIKSIHQISLGSNKIFIKLYARLCKVLSDGWVSDSTTAFRRLLLNACQEEFERTIEPPSQSEYPDEELRVKMRQKSLNNIVFIGELFNNYLIPTIIISRCLMLLVLNISNGIKNESPNGLAIAQESCTKYNALILVVGDRLSKSNEIDSLKDILQQTEVLSRDPKLSIRYRFMLKEPVELKKKFKLTDIPDFSENNNNKNHEIQLEQAPIVAPPVIDETKLQNNIKIIFENYVAEEDIAGCIDSIRLINTEYMHHVVSTGINWSLDRSVHERNLLILLFTQCAIQGVISDAQFQIGLSSIIESITELSIDVPNIHDLLSLFIKPLSPYITKTYDQFI